jgi:hypothetical protein
MSGHTVNPVSEIMPDRCTPKYERVIAKMGALLPYVRARTNSCRSVTFRRGRRPSGGPCEWALGFIIHSSSVAVSREHKRAKTDRLDTAIRPTTFTGHR